MRKKLPPTPPDAAEVLSARDGVLRVRFCNGEIRDFDAKKELFRRPYYQELAKDPALFRTAHVDYGTVVWNSKLDIDPEWLYEDSVLVH